MYSCVSSDCGKSHKFALRSILCVRGTTERFHGILGQAPFRTVSNQDHANATTEPEEWAFSYKLPLGYCITLSACRYVGSRIVQLVAFGSSTKVPPSAFNIAARTSETRLYRYYYPGSSLGSVVCSIELSLRASQSMCRRRHPHPQANKSDKTYIIDHAWATNSHVYLFTPVA